MDQPKHADQAVGDQSLLNVSEAQNGVVGPVDLGRDHNREIKAYIADLVHSLQLPHAAHSVLHPFMYQLDGARFIAERVCSTDTPYGLLFDQPGMGKSATLLWGIAAAGKDRVVIVAPLTVKSQVWTLDLLRVAFRSLEETRVAYGLNDALALPPNGQAVAVLHYEELYRRHHSQPSGALLRRLTSVRRARLR